MSEVSAAFPAHFFFSYALTIVEELESFVCIAAARVRIC